jgi:hypothetical protein
MTDHGIPGNSWGSTFGRERTFLVIEPTERLVTHVQTWTGDDDGLTIHLTPRQAREIAAELVARADLIERVP